MREDDVEVRGGDAEAHVRQGEVVHPWLRERVLCLAAKCH